MDALNLNYILKWEEPVLVAAILGTFMTILLFVLDRYI